MPPLTRNELIPDMTSEQIDSIDYFSIGKISAAGRRVSLHVEKEGFREQYPDNKRPYAREYRPATNLKSSGVSRYLFCGFDANGIARVFRVECPQEKLAHGVINTVPQTGVFLLERNVMRPEHDQKITIPIAHIASSSETGVKEGEKMMVFGLEFDKMRTDQALYPGDTGKFVTLPIKRTIALADEFLGRDSSRHINEGFALMEKHWPARNVL